MDCTVVDVGNVKLKLYVVEALATDEPIATFLDVICEADVTFGKNANTIIIAIMPQIIC